MNVDILLGKTTEHLVPLEGTKFYVHEKMLADFLQLRKAAELAGFDLRIISAFRDYHRQLDIWNAKASGGKPLLDIEGKTLDVRQLSPTDVMWAILRWSALPGASRHHWGTDIDIYDAKTQASQDVKLVPQECNGNGPAAPLHEWLDHQIDQGSSFGFYRPYRTDRGGVSPERWHLSYYPIARRITEFYTYSIFKKNIEESPLFLKDEVLEHSHEIFERYVINVDHP